MLRPSVADRQIFIPTKFPHKPITFVSRSGQREQRGKAARGEPGGTGTGSSARRVGAAGGCEPLGQVTANTTGLLETRFEARCSLSQHIQSEYLIFFSFFFSKTSCAILSNTLHQCKRCSRAPRHFIIQRRHSRPWRSGSCPTYISQSIRQSYSFALCFDTYKAITIPRMHIHHRAFKLQKVPKNYFPLTMQPARLCSSTLRCFIHRKTFQQVPSPTK